MSILRIVLLVLLALSKNIVFFKNSRALSQNSNSKKILKQGEAYYCDKKESTIFFRSDFGNVPFIDFKDKHDKKWYNRLGDKYTPLERCKKIAQRITDFDELFVISDLIIPKEEGKPIETINMCNSDKDCDELFFTLMPKDDDNPYYKKPEEIRNSIKDIFSLSKEDIEPILH